MQRWLTGVLLLQVRDSGRASAHMDGMSRSGTLENPLVHERVYIRLMCVLGDGVGVWVKCDIVCEGILGRGRLVLRRGIVRREVLNVHTSTRTLTRRHLRVCTRAGGTVQRILTNQWDT
jgi:hypothetical protein